VDVCTCKCWQQTLLLLLLLLLLCCCVVSVSLRVATICDKVRAGGLGVGVHGIRVLLVGSPFGGWWCCCLRDAYERRQ